MISPLELSKLLIQKKSLTPQDAGCLDLMSDLLQKANFSIERLDAGDVKNLFASHGSHGPLFIFLGHTDVVPTGPIEQWTFKPFEPTEHEGYLYGRGAADMKSGVAAMVWALINFIREYPALSFRVGILLTSDEEGLAQDGVKHVVEVFKKRGLKIDYCLVGEPSAKKVLGDTIKIGRRGTLSAKLTIFGKQGHIAYPHLAVNPIHLFAPALTEITQTIWDNGNEYFQPTQCQFSNILAGTGANNVIPGTLVADVNFRFCPDTSSESLQQRFEIILKKHHMNYEIHWHLGGLGFLTQKGLLVNCAQKAIQEITQLTPQLSTEGGTSDGRFIAPMGAEIVEVGVVNETIHQINECVKMEDIEKLSQIYLTILQNMRAYFSTP